jgi:amidase
MAPMMDRRSFLALAPVGAAALGCAPACPPCVPSPPAAGGFPEAPFAEVEELTIAELAGRMARGELTSAELTERYLARIDALDRRGPELRAVIEVNPEARAVAAKLDEERRAGKVRGALHGIPVMLKDNIDTGDRMQTTAGSLALEGAPAPRDATVAARGAPPARSCSARPT